ncbi:MAG TPA: hypothetical protein VHX38_01600 [Pseudonocardiaceae bacterium]|nr:hypothetical protein [Pseudonocardiaceae bacterium]
MLAVVLASAEQLKSLGDERTPFDVNGDGADFAAFGFGFPHVAVAEGGLADRATVLDLLTHLVANIRAAGLRLVLVYGVDDGFDHRAFGAFAHVEHSRDDSGADLAKVAFGDARIDTVSEDAVEVVDDHVVDVFLGFDPCDHFLKYRTLFDAGRGTTWLYEFPHNVSVERGGFACPRVPLGGNRYSFRVVVSVYLARSGDAQIENCSLFASSVAWRACHSRVERRLTHVYLLFARFIVRPPGRGPDCWHGGNRFASVALPHPASQGK